LWINLFGLRPPTSFLAPLPGIVMLDQYLLS
jgi:hypothetical protein